MAWKLSQLRDLGSGVIEIYREDVSGFYDAFGGDLRVAIGEDVLNSVDVASVRDQRAWGSLLCRVLHETPKGGSPAGVEVVVAFPAGDLLARVLVVVFEGLGVAFDGLAGEITNIPGAKAAGGDYLCSGVLGDYLCGVLGAVEVAGEDVGDAAVLEFGARNVGGFHTFGVEWDIHPSAEFFPGISAAARIKICVSVAYDIESIGHLDSLSPSH